MALGQAEQPWVLYWNACTCPGGQDEVWGEAAEWLEAGSQSDQPLEEQPNGVVCWDAVD